MPTGYTSQLEQHWDVSRWFKQELVRALGVCVSMRDEDALTSEQILKRLEPSKEGESYYAKSLKESEEALNKALGNSRAYWANKQRNEIEELKKQQDRDKADLGQKAIEYKAALKSIINFQDRAKTEGGKAIAKFALEQLGLVKSEFEPSDYCGMQLARLINCSVADYAADQIAILKRRVVTARDCLVEEQAREKERLEFYKGLLEDCKEIFGK